MSPQADSFALYRLPEGKEVVAIGNVGLIPAMTGSAGMRPATSGEETFLLAPFQEDEHHKRVEIRGPKEVWSFECGVSTLCRTQQHPSTKSNLITQKSKLPLAPYPFPHFQAALAEGRFQKLVLSHPFEATIPQPFAMFCRLLKVYPHALVYMAYTPQTGLWIGASPEVLVAGEGRDWTTMALAGTKTDPDSPWDEKNIHEQALVADYLRERLHRLARDLRETGPTTLRTGHLFHLLTTFRFRLRRDVSLEDLIRTLHPTPAVCGLPKDEALRFIRAHEGYDRAYYAGYVGPYGGQPSKAEPQRGSRGEAAALEGYSPGHTQLHVNIRCAHVLPTGEAIVYAGGGLLPSSQEDKEWAEVRRKAGALFE